MVFISVKVRPDESGLMGQQKPEFCSGFFYAVKVRHLCYPDNYRDGGQGIFMGQKYPGCTTGFYYPHHNG
jgi:hypothetical protein